MITKSINNNNDKLNAHENRPNNLRFLRNQGEALEHWCIDAAILTQHQIIWDNKYYCHFIYENLTWFSAFSENKCWMSEWANQIRQLFLLSKSSTFKFDRSIGRWDVESSSKRWNGADLAAHFKTYLFSACEIQGISRPVYMNNEQSTISENSWRNAYKKIRTHDLNNNTQSEAKHGHFKLRSLKMYSLLYTVYMPAAIGSTHSTNVKSGSPFKILSIYTCLQPDDNRRLWIVNKMFRIYWSHTNEWLSCSLNNGHCDFHF